MTFNDFLIFDFPKDFPVLTFENFLIFVLCVSIFIVILAKDRYDQKVYDLECKVTELRVYLRAHEDRFRRIRERAILAARNRR